MTVTRPPPGDFIPRTPIVLPTLTSPSLLKPARPDRVGVIWSWGPNRVSTAPPSACHCCGAVCALPCGVFEREAGVNNDFLRRKVRICTRCSCWYRARCLRGHVRRVPTGVARLNVWLALRMICGRSGASDPSPACDLVSQTSWPRRYVHGVPTTAATACNWHPQPRKWGTHAV